MPRNYLDPENVEYILTLLPDGVEFDGVQAEAIAIHHLYKILQGIQANGNYWIEKLILHSRSQRIVLRAIFMNKMKYMEYSEKSNRLDKEYEVESHIDSIARLLIYMCIYCWFGINAMFGTWIVMIALSWALSNVEKQ